MLTRLFKPRAVSASIQEETVTPKTVDISIRNLLTGKITPLFGVDSQLACALRAAGLAEPYAKPQESAALTCPRFWVAPSVHTGAVAIHVELPGGEVRSLFNATSKKAAERSLGAGEIPQRVW